MKTTAYRIVRLDDGRYRIQEPSVLHRWTGGWVDITNRGSPVNYESEEHARGVIQRWRQLSDGGSIASVVAIV